MVSKKHLCFLAKSLSFLAIDCLAFSFASLQTPISFLLQSLARSSWDLSCTEEFGFWRFLSLIWKMVPTLDLLRVLHALICPYSYFEIFKYVGCSAGDYSLISNFHCTFTKLVIIFSFIQNWLFNLRKFECLHKLRSLPGLYWELKFQMRLEIHGLAYPYCLKTEPAHVELLDAVTSLCTRWTFEILRSCFVEPYIRWTDFQHFS